MLVRIQKYLADRGVASRRAAEDMIAAGRVMVNGRTAVTGMKADDESDEVTLDGKPVPRREKRVYVMLHKPDGFVTTTRDQFGRPSVIDLLDGVKERVYPVGRLDYDTSGLLLLTNDGDMAYRLTHPSRRVEKVYVAKLFGTPDDGALERLRSGVELDGRKTAPAKVKVLRRDDRFSTVQISIYEGRNRQVRRMCEAVGHKIAVLKRVATAGLFLGDLPKGRFRMLTEREVEYLRRQAALREKG
jgi:23S rRNA pseudouridine2605 synthase